MPTIQKREKVNSADKKFISTTEVDNYEILTDEGYKSIEYLHKTIKYKVFKLVLSNGLGLKCADNHIVFNKNYEEVFVKDLERGDSVIVNGNKIAHVEFVQDLEYEDHMYDLELSEDSNHRYYTNNILSHNTELSKRLSEYLFGKEDNIIRLDMSEYSMKHEVSKLIGSPPGFIGHDEGGQLTERVKNNPYSIILLDEIEKAHEDFKNHLLQVLDEGRLTDSRGRDVDFRNTIIIMTSNIGTEKLMKTNSIGFSSGSDDRMSKKEIEASVMKELENHKMTSPEFLNRIDDVIVFNTLTKTGVKKIVEIQLNSLRERFKKDKDITLKFSNKLIKFIADEGFSEKYGARPIKRTISTYIENALADLIMNQEIKEGDSVSLDIKNRKVIKK